MTCQKIPFFSPFSLCPPGGRPGNRSRGFGQGFSPLLVPAAVSPFPHICRPYPHSFSKGSCCWSCQLVRLTPSREWIIEIKSGGGLATRNDTLLGRHNIVPRSAAIARVSILFHVKERRGKRLHRIIERDSLSAARLNAIKNDYSENMRRY